MKRTILAVLIALCLPAPAQTTLQPATFPVFRGFDSNGKPLSGGLLFSYAAGTTTPLATYTDAGGLTPNTNPVVLDSTGTARVYLGNSAYKLVLQNQFGVQQWVVDNIPGTATSVNLNPSGNQTINQPSGSTLSVNSLNAMLYVNPASATDLITQVNALFAACNNNCEVHIPKGSYTVSTGTIAITRATQSLSGDGPGNVIITYSGTNFLDWRYNSTNYTILPSGSVGGFTITCTNAAAICLSGGSTVGARWHDIDVIGPGGQASSGAPGTSQGFVFQNTYNWMERWSMTNIQIGGFSKNKHFLAPTGAGTNSYGYGKVDGVWTNQGPGSYGVVIDAGANVYNMLGFKYQINSGTTTTADEYFHIAGGFSGEGFHVTGENAGAPVTFAHVLTGGNMWFQGDYYTFGGTVTVDTPSTSGGYPPFWVGGKVGLNGYLAGSVGAGAVTGYGVGGTGPNVNVFPTEIAAPSNPGAVGTIGFVQQQGQNFTSPYVAMDTTVPYCISARAISSANNALTQIDCDDSAGNKTLAGYAKATLHDTSTPAGYYIQGAQVVHSASTNTLADGDVVIAGAPVLSGIYVLQFNGPSRRQLMTLSVQAYQFSANSNVAILGNLPFPGQTVITNPRVVLDAGSSPQLVVTIANRNAGTQLNVIQYDDGLNTSSLLPGTAVGVSATTNTGGFTGTKTAGACVLTISGGIITNVTGC